MPNRRTFAYKNSRAKDSRRLELAASTSLISGYTTVYYEERDFVLMWPPNDRELLLVTVYSNPRVAYNELTAMLDVKISKSCISRSLGSEGRSLEECISFKRQGKSSKAQDQHQGIPSSYLNA
ncbi:hypothetical protein N7448_008014 [Penicillium atrosanguineum]|nr:hypothetical protein N7448_008014 [Penicillium atrosanguineum]KAJ5147442.1 hypothetical protein N7526_000794 [Penicillium atrosanguineum]